jgi:hypothetical protein
MVAAELRDGALEEPSRRDGVVLLRLVVVLAIGNAVVVPVDQPPGLVVGVRDILRELDRVFQENSGFEGYLFNLFFHLHTIAEVCSVTPDDTPTRTIPDPIDVVRLLVSTENISSKKGF